MENKLSPHTGSELSSEPVWDFIAFFYYFFAVSRFCEPKFYFNILSLANPHLTNDIHIYRLNIAIFALNVCPEIEAPRFKK
jgi:hypothetical protein